MPSEWTIRAKVYPDLLDRIEAFMGVEEGHRADENFLALCERIAGKEVELRFVGHDAFEVSDNNYWLPDCCWEPISSPLHPSPPEESHDR